MLLLLGQVILLLLLSCGIENGAAGPNVYYKTKSVECVANRELVANLSCSLVAVSWSKSYINIDSDLLVALNNASVQVNFFKKDDNNQFKPFLFAINFNLCNKDQKYLLIPYSNVVVSHIRTYTNLNHSCPYMGHVLTRNLHLEDETVPDFPTGQYKLSLRFFENSTQLSTVQFVVEALERRKLKIKG